MSILKKHFLTLLAVGGLIASCGQVQASIVALTPADINGGVTTTASYTDAFVTLTPTVGGVASTFNADAVRLGIDGEGTNNNAFGGGGAGYNTTFGDADDEALILAFQPGAGFAGFSYDFARADGTAATDGFQISGFTANPNAVATGTAPASISYASGVLTIQQTTFANADTFLTLDPTASNGQTLTLTVADSDQAGAQLPILGISYDNAVVAVPEPTSLAVLAMGMIGLVARRRRS